MKYLLQITRSTRAERPSESQIISDSLKYEQNDYDGMVQDPTVDSFFIVNSPNKIQLSMDLIKILSMQNFSPYALSDGDGYLVIDYPFGSRSSGASYIRDGSQAKLTSYLQDGESTEVSYNTYAEAESAISLLDPSDGYILFDENPSERTLILDSRPVLWKSSSGFVSYTAINKINSHISRSDDQLMDRA